MSRVSVPKNSGSIANRVFKKLLVKTWDDYAISFSEVVRIARKFLIGYINAQSSLLRKSQPWVSLYIFLSLRQSQPQYS